VELIKIVMVKLSATKSVNGRHRCHGGGALRSPALRSALLLCQYQNACNIIPFDELYRL
jgi:hypothetical protein